MHLATFVPPIKILYIFFLIIIFNNGKTVDQPTIWMSLSQDT